MTDKKRKSIENKYDNEYLVNNYYNQSNNHISFIVNSQTNISNTYTVSINNGPNGIIFSCNCGDQWQISPKRNNCKHIGGVIGMLMSKYVNNHYSQKQLKTTNGSHVKPIKEINSVADIDDIEKVIRLFKDIL